MGEPSILFSLNLLPVKHLKALNKYFWKYRVRFFIGIIFIFLSNYFGVLAPQITRFVIDFVQKTLHLRGYTEPKGEPVYTGIVNQFVQWVETIKPANVVAVCGITILVLATCRPLLHTSRKKPKWPDVLQLPS